MRNRRHKDAPRTSSIPFDQRLDDRFASGVADTAYGTYYHHHLTVHLPHFEEIDGIKAALLAISPQGGADLDAQVDAALRAVTTFHEIRHFHDCFGTIAGITLFEMHIARLTAFGEVCRRLRKDGLKLKLPLASWALTDHCPDYVRDFVARLALGQRRQEAFLGAISLPSAAGTDDAVTKDFRLEPLGLVIPAFPLQVGSVQLEDGERTGPVAVSTRWIPIGFEQLIEGNAQAFQRTYLEAVWPSEVSARAWQMMTARRAAIENATTAIEGLISLPYNVTDLMLSKHLRVHHGINCFPRGWLTELTDNALMWGILPPHGVSGTQRHPGGAFVMNMQEIDWTKAQQVRADVGEGNLSEVVVAPSTMSTEALQKIRDDLDASPRPEAFAGNSVTDSIEYVAAFARHRIITPLLQMRLLHGDKVMFKMDQYWHHFMAMPQPPMLITDLGYRPAAESDPEFPKRWGEFVFFSDLALQIWSGAEVLLCPRAYKDRIPGIVNFEFFAPTGCNAEIARRSCLTWDAGRTSALPTCFFRRMLRAVCLIT
jgi:hypothetical protein